MSDEPLAFTLYRHNDDGTPILGHLEDAEHNHVCKTLELPWRGNATNESCIPPGVYPATIYASPKRGYDVPLLGGTAPRVAIEMHVGNTRADTDGCILLGSAYGLLGDQPAVLDSKGAFAAFMALVAGRPFTLTIVNPKPLTNPQ